MWWLVMSAGVSSNRKQAETINTVVRSKGVARITPRTIASGTQKTKISNDFGNDCISATRRTAYTPVRWFDNRNIRQSKLESVNIQSDGTPLLVKATPEMQALRGEC